MATELLSILSIWWQASNQSLLSLRLASTTADLIPYPFGSGIEEQIPILTGRIPSNRSIPNQEYLYLDDT